MFAVLYRWRLKPGREDEFRENWKVLTVGIQRTYGATGSRLHRADNGEIVAYAVWPSREQREVAVK